MEIRKWLGYCSDRSDSGSVDMEVNKILNLSKEILECYFNIGPTYSLKKLVDIVSEQEYNTDNNKEVMQEWLLKEGNHNLYSIGKHFYPYNAKIYQENIFMEELEYVTILLLILRNKLQRNSNNDIFKLTECLNSVEKLVTKHRILS